MRQQHNDFTVTHILDEENRIIGSFIGDLSPVLFCGGAYRIELKRGGIIEFELHDAQWRMAPQKKDFSLSDPLRKACDYFLRPTKPLPSDFWDRAGPNFVKFGTTALVRDGWVDAKHS
jgi:hypothetical protein